MGDGDFSYTEDEYNKVSYTHHLIPLEISNSYQTVYIGGPKISNSNRKFGRLNIFHPIGLKSFQKYKFFEIFYFLQVRFYLWKLIRKHKINILFCTTYCCFLKRKFKLLYKEKYIIQFDDEFLDPLNRLIKLYDGMMCVNYAYFQILKKRIHNKPVFHAPVLLSNNFRETSTEKKKKKEKSLNFCVTGNIDFQKFDLKILVKIANEIENSKIFFHGTVIGGTNKFLLSNLVSEFENISYHGEYNHEDTPALLSNYEFGLVPFVLNSRTMGAWPTKILEYLSCGLHVFTPDLGFEDPIRKYLNFYENFNDINQRIERLRTESSLSENTELQTILDTYMVEHRTKDFLNYAKSL